MRIRTLVRKHCSLLFPLVLSLLTATNGFNTTSFTSSSLEVTPEVSKLATTPAPRNPSLCNNLVECCPLSLRELGVEGQRLDYYGEAKIYLEPEVKQLPGSGSDSGQLCSISERFQDDVSGDASTIKLFESCSSYCEAKDVAIMAGAGWFGMNLEGALDVCLNSVTMMSPADEEFCQQGNQPLCGVEEATAQVVHAMHQLALNGLVKKTQVVQLVDAARIEALKDENKIKFDRASHEETAGVILGIYSGILSDFSNNEDHYANSLENLQEEFGKLERSFAADFDVVFEIMQKCNKMIPRIKNEAMIYDLCSVKSTKCIEDAGSGEGHVSCCCTYNPLSQLPGLYRYGDLDTSKCTFFDICSENRERTREWSRVAQLQDKITSSVYAQYVSAMKEKHPDSFRDLEIPTRSTAQGPTTLVAPSEYPDKRPITMAGKQCDSFKIGSLPTTKLPSEFILGNYSNLKVAYDFEGQITDNFCDSTYPGDQIFNRCNDFCGSSGVPLLVGTQSSPVGIDQALPVCFSPDVVAPASQNSFCRGAGSDAMLSLQKKIAFFIYTLFSFKTVQLLLVTVITDVTEMIRDQSDSEELKLRVQSQSSQSERIAVYIDFYKQSFQALEAANTYLLEIGDSVKLAFEDLKNEITNSIDNLRRYSEECYRPFPRSVGDQAVLAICPHSGDQCADEENVDGESSKYVFCCCAENIAVEQAEEIDVCSEAKDLEAEVWARVTEQIDEIEQTRRNLNASRRAQGDGSFLGSYIVGMKQRYGADYDPPPTRTDDQNNPPAANQNTPPAPSQSNPPPPNPSQGCHGCEVSPGVVVSPAAQSGAAPSLHAPQALGLMILALAAIFCGQ